MSHLLWQAFMAASTNCCHPLSHPSSWSHQALHWPAGAGAGSQAGGAQEEACAISLLHCSHLGSKAWILHNLPCNNFEEKPVREMENFQEYFNILYHYCTYGFYLNLVQFVVSSGTSSHGPIPQMHPDPHTLLALQSAPAADAHLNFHQSCSVDSLFGDHLITEM